MSVVEDAHKGHYKASVQCDGVEPRRCRVHQFGSEFIFQDSIYYFSPPLQFANMRIVIQRVFEAWVRVGGTEISRTKEGVLVLVGLTPGDNLDVVEHMANKVLNMRLWEKDGKSWNSSVVDIKGQVMAVSQFTLYGILKGNKPDFHSAMEADKARQMFDTFVDILKKKYDATKIQTGKFQHLMEVGSINNGPVTIQYEKMAQEKKPKTKLLQKTQKPLKTQKKQNGVEISKIQEKLQSLELNGEKKSGEKKGEDGG